MAQPQIEGGSQACDNPDPRYSSSAEGNLGVRNAMEPSAGLTFAPVLSEKFFESGTVRRHIIRTLQSKNAWD